MAEHETLGSCPASRAAQLMVKLGIDDPVKLAALDEKEYPYTARVISCALEMATGGGART